MANPVRLKIVEVGDKPFIKNAFPDETHFFSTYRIAPQTDKAAKTYNISFATIGFLRKLIADTSVSLIVCHPTPLAPWSVQSLSRGMASRHFLRGQFPFVRSFGPQLMRGSLAAPLVILDQDDFPLINRSNLFLLRRCALYFKRELPADRWKVFLKTAHAQLPSYRFRKQAKWISLIEKLRPIALGLPMDSPVEFPSRMEKASDVFFAGRVEGSSWIRKSGIKELYALREKGVKIDIATDPLSRDEFYRRCAQSWITWSPEGYGWECFRHYEALACGSVPLISYPSNERHKPLIENEHALFYSGEEGSLGASVLNALSDKERLSNMAEAGRSHVLTNHTSVALAQYIVEQGLRCRRDQNSELV